MNLLRVAWQEQCQSLVVQSCHLLVTALGQISGFSGQGLGFGHACGAAMLYH